MSTEQLLYFSLLTSQGVAKVGVTSSPLTSHPILSITAVRSTTPGSIRKCCPPINACGSNASLPLISSSKDDMLTDGQMKNSPIGLSYARGDWEGVSHLSHLSLSQTLWWQVTHSIYLWSMHLPHVALQTYNHFVRQIDPSELFSNVTWSRRDDVCIYANTSHLIYSSS